MVHEPRHQRPDRAVDVRLDDQVEYLDQMLRMHLDLILG